MKNFSLILVSAAVLVSTTFQGCNRQDAPSVSPPADYHPRVLRASSHQDLEAFFEQNNYAWSNLQNGVPPFILETLPKDLRQVRRTGERKKIFFLSLLPMVLLANHHIAEQRQELQQVLSDWDHSGGLSADQVRFLENLQKDYRVDQDVLRDPQARTRLLRRVDTIPTSLVLAQAASESAYGTSRFARHANNLFGEWTFIPGTGLVPRERPAGATYEVRRFDNLYDSVLSYMRNINTHRAYRTFRQKRAALRRAGQPLRGAELAEGLKLYSTRGLDYIRDLRDIIRGNRLASLAATSLRPPATPAESPQPAAGLLSTGPLSRRHLSADEAETRAD